MENAILDIQNVSVRFANGSAVQAVEQVFLSVFPGDKLCIIGETGSGKSILLLSVLRLLPPSAVVSGDVRFHGQSLFALSPKQLDGVRGGRISYVPQGSGNGMNPLLSVGLQVGEPLMAHRGLNKKQAMGRAVELMRRFHLGREEEEPDGWDPLSATLSFPPFLLFKILIFGFLAKIISPVSEIQKL